MDRALLRATTVEMTKLEQRLTFLATTASITPFIGLFGTVLGIIGSFQGIGAQGSTSLAVIGPGIAGVVLTVGMAVDANIIIYERIREELRAGKSARGAVEAGFGRAFWTVFDAHVTALVAGIVLYSYGTGPIRGFAVTLIIGVVANLFTSVWLSRAFFDYIVGRKHAARLSI